MIKQRLTAQKRNRIFLCFKNDLTATQAADICGVNRSTANRYYGFLRRAILSESIRGARREIGEYELDESCFGARRVRGKRGRGATGKTPVFGLLKRGEKVYVAVVPDCSLESLMPVIKGLILEQSTIYTAGWRAYNGLVLRRLRALPRVAGGFAANTTARTSSRGTRATSTASRTCKPAVCVGRSPRDGLRSSTVAAPPRSCYRRSAHPQRRPAGSYQEAVQENVS